MTILRNRPFSAEGGNESAASAHTPGHLEANPQTRCVVPALWTSRCQTPSFGRCPSLLSRSSCRSQQGHLCTLFRSSSAHPDICAPASRPDMRGLDVCAQSRAGGRLRDERCAARTPRQSSGGGCFCSVALSHGSARDPRAARDDVHPEHLQSELQRHGVHALLCSPAERDSRVQVRLSPASPWLLQHLATMREATPPYLHAAWLCLVCLPSELAATRSTGSSVRAPSQPSSGLRTSAPRTGPSRSSA